MLQQSEKRVLRVFFEGGVLLSVTSECFWSSVLPVGSVRVFVLCGRERLHVCVCVCVCVYERETEQERESERKSARERERARA